MKALQIPQDSVAEKLFNLSYDAGNNCYFHTPFETVAVLFPEFVIEYVGFGANWGTAVYGSHEIYGCTLICENWDTSG